MAKPVDLYGKRITTNKNDPDNMKNIARDIQEFYGLDTKGVSESGKEEK